MLRIVTAARINKGANLEERAGVGSKGRGIDAPVITERVAIGVGGGGLHGIEEIGTVSAMRYIRHLETADRDENVIVAANGRDRGGWRAAET